MPVEKVILDFVDMLVDKIWVLLCACTSRVWVMVMMD